MILPAQFCKLSFAQQDTLWEAVGPLWKKEFGCLTGVENNPNPREVFVTSCHGCRQTGALYWEVPHALWNQQPWQSCDLLWHLMFHLKWQSECRVSSSSALFQFLWHRAELSPRHRAGEGSSALIPMSKWSALYSCQQEPQEIHLERDLGNSSLLPWQQLEPYTPQGILSGIL